MLWFLVGLICIFLFIVQFFIETPRIIWMLLLGSIYFFPATLNSASYKGHVGTAPSSIGVTAYGLIIVTACIWILMRGGYERRTFVVLMPAFVLFLMYLFAWPKQSNVLSGVVHYGTAFAAMLVGVGLWRHLSTPRDRGRFLVNSILVVLIAEFVIVVGQVLGISWPYYGSVIQVGSIPRAPGTFGHPGDLGKALVLTLAILLPLSKSTCRAVRRRVIFGIALLLLLIAYSFSRANIVAALLMLLFWLFFERVTLQRIVRNAVTFAAMVIASLPFIGTFVQRFVDDPTGGERPLLTAEALEQIGRAFWLGIGPNNYVNVVGNYGRATAEGFPVHNVGLLLLAEAGFVGFIFIAAPFAIFFTRAMRQSFKSSSAGFFGRSGVALGIGGAVIGFTGYGLLANEMWAFSGLVVGFLWAGMQGHPGHAEAQGAQCGEAQYPESIVCVRN